MVHHMYVVYVACIYCVCMYSMYMCMHACMHACMYVCMYIYMYCIGTLETLKLLYDEGGIPRLYQGTELYYYDYEYYVYYTMLCYGILCYRFIIKSIDLSLY